MPDNEAVLAAIQEMRKDVCDHLHKMQEDVVQIRGDVGRLNARMESCETETREIKAETKGINTRLDETRTTVRETSNHDLEHEQKVAEDLLAAERKRAALEEDVKSIKTDIKEHRAETVAIKTELDEVKKESKAQTTALVTIAETSTEAFKAGKKLANKPAVRVLATALLATAGTWAAAHQTGCGSSPTSSSPTTPPTAVATPLTELTPYERDVAACGASFGCEESVRSRYGRAISLPVGDAGR